MTRDSALRLGGLRGANYTRLRFADKSDKSFALAGPKA